MTSAIKAAISDKGFVELMLLPPSKDLNLISVAEKNILPVCDLSATRAFTCRVDEYGYVMLLIANIIIYFRCLLIVR